MADIVATGFWIRVQNGQVVECWDYKPANDILEAQGGWKEAVQITPEVNPMREYITNHSFNLEVEPAEIVWNKGELTVDDRKGMLISQADTKYRAVLNAEVAKEVDPDPESHMDMAVVQAANETYQSRIAQINACTTQEELDAIWNV